MSRDGIDGPWSTFAMHVGTPPQNVRLLPSTSSGGLLVIQPQTCALANETSDCAVRRGDIFLPNRSASWSSLGAGRLPFVPPTKLGYRGDAAFGTDNVTLVPSLRPSLAAQVVAGIVPQDSAVIGSFGLQPGPVTSPNSSAARPSMLETLRAAGSIPSASWAYTAGSYYHQPPVLGSLVLGGFDAARFVPNNVSFAFGDDIARQLLVALQAISSAGAFKSRPLLPDGVYATVNSLEPHLWLPRWACDVFVDVFQLRWESIVGRYLIGDDVHAELLKRRPNITFRLAPSLSDSGSSRTVSIVVPYTSFALYMARPLLNESKRYFPLRRASNRDQYTLGRAFLQHAYVIADYDRSRFSVSQAILPGGAVPERLVAIRPPLALEDNSGNVRGTAPESRRAGLIGGTVGAVVLVLCTAALALFLVRRRRRRRHRHLGPAEAQQSANAARELDDFNGLAQWPVANVPSAVELSADGQPRWQAARARLQRGFGQEPAVVRRHRRSNTYELPAGAVLPAELEGMNCLEGERRQER